MTIRPRTRWWRSLKKRVFSDRMQQQAGVDRRLATSRIEPLAIVGMACRMPGGNNGVESLWQFLEKKRGRNV